MSDPKPTQLDDLLAGTAAAGSSSDPADARSPNAEEDTAAQAAANPTELDLLLTAQGGRRLSAWDTPGAAEEELDDLDTEPNPPRRAGGPSPLETADHTVRDPSARSGTRVLRGGSIERYGHASTEDSERISLDRLLEISEVAGLEEYGRPLGHADGRMGLWPMALQGGGGSSTDLYGNPTNRSDARISSHAEDRIPIGAPQGGAFAQHHMARITFAPTPQEDERDREPSAPPVSTMGRIAFAPQPSEDERDREPGAPPVATTGRISDGPQPPEDAQHREPSAPPVTTFGRVSDTPTLFSDERDRPPGAPPVTTGGRYEVQDTPDVPFRRTVPTGLESLMPFGGVQGHNRMRLTDTRDHDIPPELVGKVAVAPRMVEVIGQLQPDERIGACGDARVLKKELVQRRMDFVYSRFEELHVHRGLYHCPFHPEEPVYKGREPVFLSGGVPLGNGLLAQIITSIYNDHSSVEEQLRLLDHIGFTLRNQAIETAIDRATEAMAPVMEALRAEVAAGSNRPTVDQSGVASLRPNPIEDEPELRGELLFVSQPTAALLVLAEDAHPDPLVKSVPPSRRKGERVLDLYRETVGFNRDGLWARVRRRFTDALATSPREAAYALFLVHAITTAANPQRHQPEELLRRSRALRAWLDDQRERFDEPETLLQQSVVFALSAWNRMRFVQDTGSGAAVPEPAARRFPKTYTPMWSFRSRAELERVLTWHSLIQTCRQLGLRPWEYIFGTFRAIAQGTLTNPAQWTPAARARELES